LKAAVDAANRAFASTIRSPLTVTLGDEFQGICAHTAAGVDLILWLEHRLRQQPLRVGKTLQPYALRYVLLVGEVEPPINRENAHGMLGSGLTLARRQLEDHRRGAPRIQLELADPALAARLQDLFAVLTTLTDEFKPADCALVEALFASTDSTALGQQFD